MALVLSHADTEGLLDLEQAMQALEPMMIEEAEGSTFHMPPFGGAKSAGRTFRIVGGGLYGLGRMGVRLSSVHLMDAETGELLAIVGGPVANFRIPASMALAARHLARPDARRIGLLGSGRNALSILQALKLVRPIERVDNYSPTPEHRIAFANRAAQALDLPVRPHAHPQDAIRDADIIVVATSSYTPVLEYSDLHPGVHVSSMGMTTEIGESVFLRVDQVVAQSAEQEVDSARPDVHPYVEGALWRLVQQGRYDPSTIVRLGSIIRGDVAPRNGPADITLFRDSRGGVGDIALASYVYERARELGRGIVVDL